MQDEVKGAFETGRIKIFGKYPHIMVNSATSGYIEKTVEGLLKDLNVRLSETALFGQMDLICKHFGVDSHIINTY